MYFQIPLNGVALSTYYLFTSNISINSYNTRNKSNLRQPRSKYEYMYRNFSYMMSISGINSKTILIFTPAIVHLALHSKPSFC